LKSIPDAFDSLYFFLWCPLIRFVPALDEDEAHSDGSD
jgi:hypothetical protein